MQELDGFQDFVNDFILSVNILLESQPQFCRVRESNLFFSCCLLLFYKAATADIISVYKTAVVGTSSTLIYTEGVLLRY